jgi:hypothetical protein
MTLHQRLRSMHMHAGPGHRQGPYSGYGVLCCQRVWYFLGSAALHAAAIAQGVALLVVCLFLLTMLHENTYVWQSTVGNHYLAPSARSSCDLGGGRGGGGDGGGGAPAITILGVKPRIALISLHGGDWPLDLMLRVRQNKEFYAKYHGYTFVDGNSYVDHTRPVAWSKLLEVSRMASWSTRTPT